MVILIFLFFADSLFKEGDYFNAITEYKRELFFKKIDEKTAYLKIGKCYEKLGYYEKSAFYYGKYYFLEENVSEEFILNYSYVLFKMGKYEEAVSLLKGLKESRKKDLLLSYGYLKINDEKNFLKYFPEKNSYTNKKILKFISFIIPGLPIILTGHISEGITSFLMNLGTGYLVYKSFREKDYFGLTLNFSLFWRFYTGNIQATENFIKKDFEKTIEKNLERF